MNTSRYRFVWRWHFFTGLIVLPVLVWLAVTGGLYLYKPEIERALYREWIELGGSVTPMPVAGMIGRVEQATGGKVKQLTRPAAANESWRMNLEAPDGARRTAFVDPRDGRVLGTTSQGGVMEAIRSLHSLAITGPVGNALIEIVAGWAIILVVTGFYLWWPRRGQKALALRGRPRERLFWRDLHVSAGALVGAVILFLAVTGMPWSVVWGEALQQIVVASGGDRPAAPVVQPHSPEHEHHDQSAHDSLPWSLQAAAPPQARGQGDIGPDQALALAEARGLTAPYTLNLPNLPAAPYSISRVPDRASDAHLIYIEPATGRVLQDARYADFGAGAQAIEWGIYTHQGQTYGEANRLVMLAGCIGVILLAISAPTLWWKRRRAGRLEAPPRPTEPKQARGMAALMIALGLLYPLTGLTMLAAWLADRRFGRRTPVT